MTQPNLLELAKQGDAKAIAQVLNYILKDKGITAKALLKDSCLLVMLESAQVPDQQASVVSIRTALRQLGVPFIKSVKIYGKKPGQDSAAWRVSLDLTPQVETASTQSPNLTHKVESEEPNKQTSPVEPTRPDNLKANAGLWPAWFPYPSSWFRALILVPIAFPGAFLIDIGFGGILLSIITNNPLSLISFTLLGLSLPTIFISFIYHLFWFRWHKPSFLTRHFKCWQDSNSWWEGLYATLVIGLSFLILVAILLAVFYLPCSIGHTTTEELSDCTLQGLGSALQTTYENIKNIWNVHGHETFITKDGELTGRLWCGVWLTIASYLYQAEYLMRKRFKYKRLATTLLLLVLGFWVAQAVYLVSSTRSQNAGSPVPITSQTALPEASSPATVTPTPVTSQTPSPQPDPFRLAVNKAMSAANLTQTAKSKQDWNTVTSQWQEAIALMKAVPASSPNYAVAQKKAAEYQKNLDFASSAASRAQ